ncbi:MAG: hypothetical protein RR483_04680 [Clostridia bacterium]
MFENFGLKDLWSNIKKFKVVLIIILILTICFGITNYFMSKNQIKESEYRWISSAFYNVVTKEDNKDEGIENLLKRNASSYQIMVKSDVANEYVYNKILSDYSKKEIIEKCDLNIAEEDFKPITLDELFVCKVLESTNILNLFAQTKDQEISKKILNYYEEYLNKVLEPTIEKGSLVYMSGTTQNSKMKNESNFNMGYKGIIILFLLVVVLECLFVIIYSFVKPTINTNSDFEKYGVKVFAKLN